MKWSREGTTTLLTGSSPRSPSLFLSLTHDTGAVLDGGRAFPLRLVTAYVALGQHGVLVVAIQKHLELFPDLLTVFLDQLKKILDSAHWYERRMILAATAACMEAMPAAFQQASHGKLEDYLCRGAIENEDYKCRHFALTALGYFRTLTPKIVTALAVCCQDTYWDVQEAIIATANRFQSIADDAEISTSLLPLLTSENVEIAYTVTKLLGALGSSRPAMFSKIEGQIIEALISTLKSPRCKQKVDIWGPNIFTR